VTRALEPALAALCLLLVGAIAYQLWRPALAPDDLPPALAPRASAPEAAHPVVAMPPIEAFAEFVARPLFTPTRRPAPPVTTAAPSAAAAAPTPPPAPQPPALNQVTLVGVTITPEGRSALLRTGGPPKVVRVREGDSFQGWAVKRIQSDKVSFAWASSEIDVKFPVGGVPAAARPMATPSQPPTSPPPSASHARPEPIPMPSAVPMVIAPTARRN